MGGCAFLTLIAVVTSFIHPIIGLAFFVWALGVLFFPKREAVPFAAQRGPIKKKDQKERIPMENTFGRRGAGRINDLNRSLAGLVGIVTGMLADQKLNDDELRFLNEWLGNNAAVTTSWPGDVIFARIKAVLADGVITEDEHAHLVKTLQDLVGGTLEELAASTRVTKLAMDEVDQVEFQGASFCLTGDFVIGPKGRCEELITSKGGVMKSSVSKKVRYLVVGGLGSPEWKHGSFGTKIEKAMKLKQEGADILIMHENFLTRHFQAS